MKYWDVSLVLKWTLEKAPDPENFMKIPYRLLATVGLYRPSFFLRWQPLLCLPWLFYPLVSHLSACLSSVISWLHHNFFLLNPSKPEGTIWNKSYCFLLSLALWLSFFTLLSGMEIPRFALDSEVIFLPLTAFQPVSMHRAFSGALPEVIFIPSPPCCCQNPHSYANCNSVIYNLS